MKLFVRKDKRTKLEKEIDSVLDVMSKNEPSSEEYIVMSENLERLYKAKSLERPSGVTADAVLIVAGNLLGIGLVLGYEKTQVITTKAFGMILRGRV